MAAQTVIKLRRETAANWTATNPILAAGEQGWESDTNKKKIGTGAAVWTALPYEENLYNADGSLTGARVVNLSGNALTFDATDGTDVMKLVEASTEVAGVMNIAETGTVTLGQAPSNTTTTTELRFAELAANGTNYMGFKAPVALTGDTTFTLPDGDGTSGQALLTDGSGTLAWSTVLTATGVELFSGAGSPEGAQTAGTGSLYVNTTDGAVYTKESGTGNTGWGKLAIETNLGTLTEEAISANTDDWNPTDVARGTVLVNVTGNRQLSGVAAQANGSSLKIVNVGSGTLTFKKENTGSVAANRLAAGADIAIGSGEYTEAIYSTTLSRWVGLA